MAYPIFLLSLLRILHHYLMKKSLLILVLVLFAMLSVVKANPIDVFTAIGVVLKFMNTDNLRLVKTYFTTNSVPAFYVFNAENGFVIISAEDFETPVIGYSNEGVFDENKVPFQMREYLNDFVVNIQYGIENHVVADEKTQRKWHLAKTGGRLNDSKILKEVSPMLTAHWAQGCYYNAMCPADTNGVCGHAVVGCVAVAMAQIMHYYGYPQKGSGNHSYSTNYGIISADFGNAFYDWINMPDSLSHNSSATEIDAVSQLLYHCGVAVDMGYSANGSGASSNNVIVALKNYFGYADEIFKDRKGNYTNDEWLAKVKYYLDYNCPLFYSGAGSAIHSFVCDGYDSNDMLHFNWGWNGSHNGYFALGNMYPNGYNLSNNNTAIFGITPYKMLCQIASSVYPLNCGTVSGNDYYFQGSQCTLTAMSNDDTEFYCWTDNGQVVSYDETYSFEVLADNNDIVANFTYRHPTNVTAVYYPNVNDSLSRQVKVTWECARGQIVRYCVHRLNNSGDDVVLANFPHDYSYVDVAWARLKPGLYKYGISSVYANGEESPVVWSESIEKPGAGGNDDEDDDVIEALSVFPNPVGDNLYVESPSLIERFEVFNDVGMLIFEKSTNTNILKIDVSVLSSGTYIIRLTSGDGVETRKFNVAK